MGTDAFAESAPKKDSVTESLAGPAMAAAGRSRSILPWLCGIGSAGAWVVVWDLAWYLSALSSSKLANPPKSELLLVILMMAFLLGLMLAVAAWRAWQRGTPQRAVAAGWASGWMIIGGVGAGLLMLVNYPIPAQAHHLDKFLGGLLAALVWSGWFLIRPQALARTLTSRPVRWLGIALVNLLIFLLVGEATVRLADPLLARSGLFGDKHTPANLKPHIPVRGSIGFTNSQGFRDRERVVERTVRAPRVLAVGDSFTWGAGVSYDEVFVTLLERRLQSSTPDAEVINVGVPAWGPHEELHLLKAYGVRFQPDLVLLNFFIGNDIQNKRGESLSLPQILIVAGQSYYVHSDGNWVHDRIGTDRWYLYHDLNYLLRVGGARLWRAVHGAQERVADAMSSGESAPLVSREQYVRGIYERSDIYLAEDTRYFAQHWARTQHTLLAFRDVLAERNIPMLLVVIPDPVQLDGMLQKEYLASVGQGADRYDFQKPSRLLLAWCREQGIPTVELLPAFEAAEKPAGLYFQNDIHLTASGHRLAAQVIGPALQAQLQSQDNVKGSEGR